MPARLKLRAAADLQRRRSWRPLPESWTARRATPRAAPRLQAHGGVRGDSAPSWFSNDATATIQLFGAVGRISAAGRLRARFRRWQWRPLTSRARATRRATRSEARRGAPARR
eukprot:8889165-Pyramimonas_sp.AAC.1